MSGTDAGLTDAEVDMRDTVQTLRDRLKSGLLGWLENIRLQYDHLTTRLKEEQRASAPAAPLMSSNSSGGVSVHGSWGRNPASATGIPSSQEQSLISALKAEGAEIDALIKAVEKINLAAKFTPSLNQSSSLSLSFSG